MAEDVPMREADLKEARKRSVDNLQRLYTFIVSLAVTESLRRLLMVFGASADNATPAIETTSRLDATLMFVSLIFTVVPFYHGANRYLDATYVTNERAAIREALAIDFLLLFLEGLLFFVLAVLTTNTPYFYSVLGILFLFDAFWVWTTNLTAKTEADRFPKIKKWATVNLVAALLLFIFVWSNLLRIEMWADEVVNSIVLVLVPIARTLYDYYSVWDFYYPRSEGSISIPAPPPAPTP